MFWRLIEKSWSKIIWGHSHNNKIDDIAKQIEWDNSTIKKKSWWLHRTNHEL